MTQASSRAEWRSEPWSGLGGRRHGREKDGPQRRHLGDSGQSQMAPRSASPLPSGGRAAGAESGGGWGQREGVPHRAGMALVLAVLMVARVLTRGTFSQDSTPTT